MLELIDMRDILKNINGDLPVNKIRIIGTHDSAACYSSFSLISKTQRLTLMEQLNVGARYFDFRFKFSDNVFYAMHGIARCRVGKSPFSERMTADYAVACCKDFLAENPDETILFQLKETESSTGNEFYTEFFKRYIKPMPDLWYVKNSIPTLNEVRGKIVLLRVVQADKAMFSDDSCGIDFSGYPYVPEKETDNFKRGDITSLSSGKAYAHMLVQDSYKAEGEAKWGTVCRFIENQSDCEFNICLSSCTNIFVPRINARFMNKRLKGYDFKSSLYSGILACDYIDIQIVENFYLNYDNYCKKIN